MVIAGGDGSLVGAVTGAQNAGVDISKVPCCVLPYGTGNDLARCTNWGGEPVGRVYQTLRNLMIEICENAREEKLNVWNVHVTFKERGGDTFEVDSRTKRLAGKGKDFFNRDMLNYFGIGEDGRVGVGFEMYRTNSRCCNRAVYGTVGTCLFFCNCTRGHTVAE
jgi:Diacylglycerol kinase catalytic domain/Diacylglycerol kinase accessory domain